MLRALCIVALLLTTASAAMAAEPQVVIKKADWTAVQLTEPELPVYTVEAPAYKAEVYRDGRVRVLAGKTELFRNLVLELGRKVKTLGDIRQGKASTITLREGEIRKKELEPAKDGLLDEGAKTLGDDLDTSNMPGITLQFLADRIEITAAALRVRKTNSKEQPPVFDLSGLFGDDAVALRNLQTGDEDALPARYIADRHIFSFYGWYGRTWPEIEVTYKDGTKAAIREITGVSHYAIGKGDPYTNEALKASRGFWSLREVTDKSRIVLAIKPGDGKSALDPAPYFTLKSEKPRCLFYEGEPVQFRLDFAESLLVPGRYKLEWKLEDHMQRPVGTAREQAVTIEAGKTPQVIADLTPKEMGYFRGKLIMSRADGHAARRMQEFSFSRIRPECPALRDLDGKGGDAELLWANILGMRGLRLNPSWSSMLKEHQAPDTEIDWDAVDQRLAKDMEIARTGTTHGLFSFTGADLSKDMAAWFEKRYPDTKEGDKPVHNPERDKAIQEARARYLTGYAKVAKKYGIAVWEPINEPDLGMPPEKYAEDFLKVQYPAVKAGNPEAIFLGGSCCGLDKYTWVRKLYELGAQKYFDGLSFHPYTGNGFQEIYRAELDQWQQVLRDFKEADRGIWMTECAWHRGWVFSDFVYDKFKAFRQSQARNAVAMHLNAEAMRIPRDRIYVFYLTEHGYNEFYLVTYEYPTAPAIAIQVMNEALRDAKFQKELPLPGKGRHFQLYQDKTRTVAAAFTSDEPADLVLATDAAEVTATDLMGNRQTLKPAGGKIKVTISGDPTYLAVKPGQSIAPAYDGLAVQPNLALPTLGATASASSVAKPKNGQPLPLGVAISGDWTCYASAMALTGGRRGWDADEATKDTPQWFEVKLPQPTAVSRVRVYHDYGAWERILKDYDVQVQAGGEWKTVGEMRDNHYRFIGDHAFDAVKTDRVRVLATKVNSCLFDNMEWIPRIATLRAVEVYGPPAGAAKAFFVEGVPRKRILAPGGTIELAVRLQNVLDAKVSGEVRLKLPEGVTAEADRAKLDLPAKGDAECVLKVKLADQAAEGLYTVVAGFYDGETLVSSDYDPLVLCCKKGK